MEFLYMKKVLEYKIFKERCIKTLVHRYNQQKLNNIT